MDPQPPPPVAKLKKKYAGAVAAAFASSMLGAIVLFNILLNCDVNAAWLPLALTGFFVMFAAVGFVGVLCGTLCLPEPARSRGSMHLLILGLAFAVLPALLFSFGLCLIPLALGGFMVMKIFRQRELETSAEAAKRRITRACWTGSSLLVFLGVVCFVAHTPAEVTEAQAREHLAKVGGIEKVNQEATLIFARFRTNEVKSLYGSALEAFPSISGLGHTVLHHGTTPEQAPYILIGFGTHHHPKQLIIFPQSLDVDNATNFANVWRYLNDPSYYRVTTNIFVRPAARK